MSPSPQDMSTSQLIDAIIKEPGDPCAVQVQVLVWLGPQSRCWGAQAPPDQVARRAAVAKRPPGLGGRPCGTNVRRSQMSRRLDARGRRDTELAAHEPGGVRLERGQ